MKNKDVALSFFFLLAPLYSLPIILKRIFDNDKYAFFLFALFMGLLAYLFPPCGDFSRYYLDYEILKGATTSQLWDFLRIRFDYIQSIVLYLLGKYNLNSDYSRLFFTLISYGLLSKIYIEIISNNALFRTRKQRKLAFWAFFLISITVFSFRFSFSAVLYVYGIYLLYYCGKRKGWIFILLSILNHVTFVCFLVPLVIYKFSVFRLSKKKLIVMVIVAGIISNFSMTLLDYLPFGGDLFDRYIGYIDGYWAGDYRVEVSLKGMLFEYLTKITYYGVILIYIYTYPGNRSDLTKQHQLLNSMLFICLLFSVFPVVIGRFLLVLSLAMKVHIFANLKTLYIAKKAVCLLCILTILYDCIGLWASRRELLFSDECIIITSSIYGVLEHSYDGKWFDSNIGDDGSIVKLDY